jgi:hypothetical protein
MIDPEPTAAEFENIFKRSTAAAVPIEQQIHHALL